MLPKLHEEAMALPSEEEFAERKRPEQPALATLPCRMCRSRQRQLNLPRLL